MRRLLVTSDPKARKILDKPQKHRALSRASLLEPHLLVRGYGIILADVLGDLEVQLRGGCG